MFMIRPSLGQFMEFDVINETGSRMFTNESLEAAGKPPCFPSSHTYDSGILFTNRKPKPEYFALKKLFQETWTTRFRGALGPDGSAGFRGFFETYEAKRSGFAPVRFTATVAGPRSLTATLTASS